MTELLNKNTETSTEKGNPYKKYLVGAVAVCAALFAYHEAFKLKPDNQPINSNAPVTQEQNSRCAQTWEMTGFGHNNGDWIENGVNEIKKGDEKQAPREVLSDWLTKVAGDNTTLDYLSESIHKAADNEIIAIDAGQLVSNEGCATDSAVNEVEYIKNKLNSADISYGLAPTSGINTYVDEHNEIQNSTVPTDEREAIVIDLRNGNYLYVLGVCGNLVSTEKETIIIKKTIIIENKEKKDKKHKNTPKSSNSSDYKQPGDDSERDSGNGEKGKAVISTPAESTPPKVETKSGTTNNANNGSVTD